MPATLRTPPQCETGAIISFPDNHELHGRGWEVTGVESAGIQRTLRLEDVGDPDVTAAVEYGVVEKRAHLERAARSVSAVGVPVSLECLLAEARALRLGGKHRVKLA